MWLFTPRGFFSAVQKSEDVKDEMMTIRGRAKKDLENLHDILPDAVPYAKDGYTDYPWRIRVPQKDWAMAVAAMALEIDYSNFKDEVTRTQGKKRHDIYSQIWGVMLQAETGKKKYSYGGSGGYGSYGSYKARKWKSGDRIWNSFKKKAATVASDDSRDIKVIYDDEPNVEQKLEFRGDAKPLRVVGDRVWDEWAHQNGEITSINPLVVIYEDGSLSDHMTRLVDLDDPHTSTALTTTTGEPKLFEDQTQSQTQRTGKNSRSVKRSTQKRGQGGKQGKK